MNPWLRYQRRALLAPRKATQARNTHSPSLWRGVILSLALFAFIVVAVYLSMRFALWANQTPHRLETTGRYYE